MVKNNQNLTKSMDLPKLNPSLVSQNPLTKIDQQNSLEKSGTV